VGWSEVPTVGPNGRLVTTHDSHPSLYEQNFLPLEMLVSGKLAKRKLIFRYFQRFELRLNPEVKHFSPSARSSAQYITELYLTIQIVTLTVNCYCQILNHSPIHQQYLDDDDDDDDNSNIYLLQLGCHPLAVVILHVNKT